MRVSASLVGLCLACVGGRKKYKVTPATAFIKELKLPDVTLVACIPANFVGISNARTYTQCPQVSILADGKGQRAHARVSNFPLIGRCLIEREGERLEYRGN